MAGAVSTAGEVVYTDGRRELRDPGEVQDSPLYNAGIAAVGGAYTAAGTPGPFPSVGLLPFLRPLYDYSWVVGLVVAFVLYYLLMVLFPAEHGEPEQAAAPA
jgi:cytosine/uracil/thiamine/allantoin permease